MPLVGRHARRVSARPRSATSRATPAPVAPPPTTRTSVSSARDEGSDEGPPTGWFGNGATRFRDVPSQTMATTRLTVLLFRATNSRSQRSVATATRCLHGTAFRPTSLVGRHEHDSGRHPGRRSDQEFVHVHTRAGSLRTRCPSVSSGWSVGSVHGANRRDLSSGNGERGPRLRR